MTQCFPYLYSHGNQGNHRRLGSSTLSTVMSILRSLQISFGGIIRISDCVSEIFLSLCSFLWIENQVKHFMRCILLTDLSEAGGLSIRAEVVPEVKPCVVHRTFENLHLFNFQVSMTLCWHYFAIQWS